MMTEQWRRKQYEIWGAEELAHCLRYVTYSAQKKKKKIRLHFSFIQRGSHGIFVLCTRCTRIDAAKVCIVPTTVQESLLNIGGAEPHSASTGGGYTPPPPPFCRPCDRERKTGNSGTQIPDFYVD